MDTRDNTIRRSGFTLVELMAVLAILAVLAAIALPSFSNYIKRTRTTEAVMNLERMWQSAVAYFNTEHATHDGRLLPRQFPSSAPATPDRDPSGNLYEPNPADWDHPTWSALNFAMSSPHFYQYGFYNRGEVDGPPGGGGAAFSQDGPFASPGGPISPGPFGGPDGKPGAPDKKARAPGDKQDAPAATLVTICHFPPGDPENAQTLTVAEPAVLHAFLALGAILGPCPGDDDPLADRPDGDLPPGGGDPADPKEDDPFAVAPQGHPCAHLFTEGAPFPGFYVTAAGDLDSDENYAYFYRGSLVTPDCELLGPPMVLSENPLE